MISVRATLRLRNDAMISARKRMGLTQKALGMLCDASQATIGDVERFNFRYPLAQTIAPEVAEILGLELTDILPPEFRGIKVESSFEQIGDMSPERLLSLPARKQRLLTLSPVEILEGEEARAILDDVLGTLTYREREVIKLRFGLGGEDALAYREMGRIFKVTRERVRQIEARAIRKLQHPVRADRLKEAMA